MWWRDLQERLTIEEIEKFLNEKLSDRVGEFITVTMKPIAGFDIYCVENEADKYYVVPFNILFSSKRDLEVWMNGKQITQDGKRKFPNNCLRSVEEDHIVISGNEAVGEYTIIKNDDIDCIEFLKTSYIKLGQ